MKILVIGSEDAYKYSKNMFLMQKIEEYTKEHPECNIEVVNKTLDDLKSDKEKYNWVVYDEVSPAFNFKEKSKANKPYWRQREG